MAVTGRVVTLETQQRHRTLVQELSDVSER